MVASKVCIKLVQSKEKCSSSYPLLRFESICNGLQLERHLKRLVTLPNINKLAKFTFNYIYIIDEQEGEHKFCDGKVNPKNITNPNDFAILLESASKASLYSLGQIKVVLLKLLLAVKGMKLQLIGCLHKLYLLLWRMVIIRRVPIK